MSFAATPGRRALVVLGMHRSGTSAFARVYNLLGAELPRTLLSPDDFAGNPLGFWEPLEIVRLHDELLDAVGRTWHDFSPLPASWFSSELVRSYEPRLAEVVREEYGDAPLFVVKDPRISRLVPLWRAVLDRAGATPAFAIVLRNPLEVAASLKERDTFGPTKSLLLWLRYVLDAERATRGQPRTIVAYEDLLQDWRAVVGRTATELGLAWPRHSHGSALVIDRFLSQAHRHHAFTGSDLEARADVARWVKDVYGALLQLARDPRAGVAPVLDAVARELDESDRTYGLLVAERDSLIQHLNRKLGRLDGDRAAAETELEARGEELQRAVKERDAVAEP